MPRVSARAQKPRYETVPLDLQQAPRREDGTVATVRIVSVGGIPAARSGGTWQIPGTVPPARPAQPRPQVIYARPVQVSSAPEPHMHTFDPAMFEPAPRQASGAFDSKLFEAPRQCIADLQMRAIRALGGVQEHASTQRIVANTWAKPSTKVMSIAVAVYALALFLFAVLSR